MKLSKVGMLAPVSGMGSHTTAYAVGRDGVESIEVDGMWVRVKGKGKEIVLGFGVVSWGEVVKEEPLVCPDGNRFHGMKVAPVPAGEGIAAWAPEARLPVTKQEVVGVNHVGGFTDEPGHVSSATFIEDDETSEAAILADHPFEKKKRLKGKVLPLPPVGDGKPVA